MTMQPTRPCSRARRRRALVRRASADVAARPRRGSRDRAVVRPGRSAAEHERPERAARGETHPGWRRFLDEYRSYMQIILVAAAVVSLLVKEWSTACSCSSADRAERGRRPAPAGQGRERDERAQVDDEGDRQGAA